MALLLVLLLSAGRAFGAEPAPGPEQAPAEKTGKEVDVARTLELLPSKVVLIPVSLFEGGLKRTLNFVEGERLADKLDYYVRYLNNRGLYPSAYDLGDGSGVGVGLAVRRSPEGRVCLGGAAGLTYKLYQAYQASASLPFYGGGLILATRAGYTYRPEEEFYGIGPASSTDARTDYLVEDGFFEGTTRLGYPERLQLVVAARWDVYRTKPGRDSSVRSIQEVFTPVTAPGLFESIHYASGGFSLVHDSRDWPQVPTRGGRQQLGAAIFHETTGRPFDFYRASLQLEQLLPFSSLKHAFLVRAFAEVNQPLGDSDQVPFFLLARLGGSYLLRGFHELRFYDERAVEWSLEYRYRIWSRADAFLYVDQGEVFGRSQGFSASQIATSGGGGLMVRNFGFAHSEDIISGGPGFEAPVERLFFMLLLGATGEGVRPFITFGAFI